MNIAVSEKDIENMVTRAYRSPHLTPFPYHNLDHTRSVVAYAREIAAHYLLNESQFFVLIAAAWFHDIGHLYGDMHDHEERGVLVMEGYLKDLPVDLTAAIGQTILATKFPSAPKNLLEQIICDADTYHFGTPLFRQTDALMQKEMEMRSGKKNPDWHEDSLQLLKQHHFYTGYCRHRLTEGKNDNIAWLESLIP